MSENKQQTEHKQEENKNKNWAEMEEEEDDHEHEEVEQKPQPVQVEKKTFAPPAQRNKTKTGDYIVTKINVKERVVEHAEAKV